MNQAKVFKWVKLISITGAAQIIVQIASLTSGILIIRFLPIKEYAYYTIANTMLATLNLLSDSGISAGALSQGGKVWNDRNKLGLVLVTALKLRNKFAAYSLVVVIPIMDYFLFQHGASILTIILITVSIIPAFYASLSDTLLEAIPKLHQNLLPLQINQVVVGIGKLIMTSALLFLFPFTYLALLAAGIPRVLGNIKLRKIVNEAVDLNLKEDAEVKREMMRAVKNILPGTIYYSFSTQISVWLISIFGSTSSIAEVGALGRLGMLLNFFSVLISTLIIPRFARLGNDKGIILKKFLTILILIFGLSIILCLLCYLFPTQILIILGTNYKGLAFELLLSLIVSCITLINGTIYSLSISRAYYLPPIFNIGLHLVSQIILIMTMNLSSTRGILVFSIIDALVIFSMFFINFLYCLKKVV